MLKVLNILVLSSFFKGMKYANVNLSEKGEETSS